LLQASIKINPRSKTVLLNLQNIKQNAQRAMRRGLAQIGELLVKETKEGITNPPKTGLFYKYKGRNIQASAVGEYAANRSGKLRGSINSKSNKDTLIFGAKADYGKFLENGTRKMRKRENLLKSIVATRGEQILIIEKQFARELNK
jgi:phage gpG-like protein